jgi:RHS repeat-associated protein
METESGDGGFTYRYSYGLQKENVVIYGIPNGAGSLLQKQNYAGGAQNIVKLYYHKDRLGSTDYLTDNIAGKVTSYATYDDWGELTAKAIVKMGVRMLDLVQEYTGHSFDQVLNLYYAKARMYDAQDRRFVAMDWAGSNIAYIQLFNQYAYVINNPLIYVDPLGLWGLKINGKEIKFKVRESDGEVYLDFSQAVKAAGGSISYDELKGITQATINGINGSRYKYTGSGISSICILNNPQIDISSIPAIKTYDREGIKHVNTDYFQKLMCALGIDIEYVEGYLSQTTINNTANAYQLSKRQKGGLYKINQYYDIWDDNVNKNETGIFAYEGLGTMSTYNAMMVITRNHAIPYVTLKGSTLPTPTAGKNKAKDGIATVNEGTYLLVQQIHKGYTAAQVLNLDGTDGLKCTRVNRTYPANATGINFHTGAAGASVAWSEGCQMVFESEYVKFGIAAGFIKEEATALNLTTHADIKSKLINKYSTKFTGLYVLDRSFI